MQKHSLLMDTNFITSKTEIAFEWTNSKKKQKQKKKHVSSRLHLVIMGIFSDKKIKISTRFIWQSYVWKGGKENHPSCLIIVGITIKNE